MRISKSGRFELGMFSCKRGLCGLPAFRNNKSFRDVSPTDPEPRLTTPITATAKSPNPSKSSSQRNLWEEAFEKLTAEERHILTEEQHKEPLGILKDVIDVVEQISLEYQKGGWKIHMPGSKPHFNVRDGAVKVVKSVTSFKALISSGVALDPTGHGKPPPGLKLDCGTQSRVQPRPYGR